MRSLFTFLALFLTFALPVQQKAFAQSIESISNSISDSALEELIERGTKQMEDMGIEISPDTSSLKTSADHEQEMNEFAEQIEGTSTSTNSSSGSTRKYSYKKKKPTPEELTPRMWRIP